MKRFVSLWMIALVLSLPVVFAQELTLQKYSGEAGNDGFAASYEDVTIEVLASLAGMPVNRDNVRLFIAPDTANFIIFDSCELESGNLYRCTYTADVTWPMELDFTVQLVDYDAPPNVVLERTGSILVEDNPPVVNEFDVDTDITNGPVEFVFDVEDYGLNYGSASDCSGIRRITINTGVDEVVQNYNSPGVCQKQGVVSYSYPQATGEYDVYITAEDFAGLESDPFPYGTITVDQESPMIAEFAILDETGSFKLTHVRSGESAVATAVARVRDNSSISVDNVEADFSDVDPSFSGFIPADSRFAGSGSNQFFVWDDLEITEVEDCEVTVRARDDLDNLGERTFDCDVRGDDVPPDLVGVLGERRDNKVLVGQNTTLRVEFEDLDNEDEEGVGLQARKAYLDLSALGMGSSVRADDCVFDDTWVCSWSVEASPNVASGDYVVYITTDTRDDLNNAIPQELGFDVEYDVSGPTQPVIVDKQLISATTQRNVAVRGDTLKYVVQSDDFNETYANFSGIGGDDRQAPLSCVPGDTLVNCTFQSYIQASGYYETALDFVFVDDAGNEAVVSDDVVVYNITNDANPDYWTYRLECSPAYSEDESKPLVDRFLNPQMGQFFSCVVKLRPNIYGQDVSTASIVGPGSVLDCTADNPALFSSVSLINTRTGSENPVMLVEMAPAELPYDSTMISCPIYISSLVEGGVTSNVETEDVVINVTMHGTPMSDIYENIEERVKNQYDTVDDFSSWFEWANTFVRFSESLCNVKQIIANVLGAIDAVVALIEATEISLDTLGLGGWVKPSRVASCGAYEGVQNTAESTVIPVLDQFCAIMNCQATSGKHWSNYLGGGLPYCQSINDAYMSWLDLADQTEGESGMKEISVGQMLPIQDSLFWSTACLCLPGIIKNVDKLRQIECKRATCLARDHLVAGMPVSFCDESYHMMQCNFIVGQIWSIVPLSKFIDMVSDMIAEWIANPFSVLTTAFGAYCTALCNAPSPGPHLECSIPRVISIIGESVGSVEAIFEAEDYFGGSVSDEWCREYEQVKREWDPREE